MIYGNKFLDEISLDLMNIEESANSILQEAEKDPNNDVKNVIDKSNKSNEEIENKTNGLLSRLFKSKKKSKNYINEKTFPWYRFAVDVIPCYAENVKIYFDYDLGNVIKSGKVETEDQLKSFLAELEKNIDTMFPTIIMKKDNKILKEYFEKGMNATEFNKKFRGFEKWYLTYAKNNKLKLKDSFKNWIKQQNFASTLTNYKCIISNEKFHYQIIGIDYETIYEYKSTHDFSASYISHYKSLIKKLIYDVERVRLTINTEYARITTQIVNSRISNAASAGNATLMQQQQMQQDMQHQLAIANQQAMDMANQAHQMAMQNHNMMMGF